MPLNRRLPKFGFNNIYRVEYQVINLATLQDLVDNKKIDKSVDPEMLFKLGVISKSRIPLKILGNGEIKTALNVTADGFSESAKQKIESAGGTVTING
jgi:large subunit ribosomal protein L15